MKRLVYGFVVLVLVLAFQAVSMALPKVDALLNEKINALPLGLTPVIITFNSQPSSADFLMLRTLGITGGYKTNQLPMILTLVNKTQFNALKQKSNIRSLYANRIFKPLNNESRKFIGVESLLADFTVTAMNQGLPVTGKNIGVAYIDTGIDATHPDLKLGENVAQNVFFPTAEIPLNLPTGFLPVVPVENVPISDVEGGHGTFGAGVTAGTGAASGGFYRGVAPGAKLIGLTAGNDVGLSTFAILQAMD